MEMESDNRWLTEFLVLCILTMISAGVLYLYQQTLDQNFLEYNLFRMIRMIAVYVVPTFWFVRRHSGDFEMLGIMPPKTRSAWIISIFFGNFIYFVAGLVFVKERIFFAGWPYYSPLETFVNLAMIGVMAAITDYWTRGFVLLHLSKRYNEFVGILGQNVCWFILHFYEIELLAPYIGWGGAILMTLFLGITGDLVALKTKNLYGLMMGHLLLNVMVAMTSRGIWSWEFLFL